jgi:transcriptional regulator with XRE-family HTH domain
MDSASPPEVPPEFWSDPEVRGALASQHMGQVIYAYRQHPAHGRRPISQEVVAAWAGMSQGQLSRVETGPPIVHLDRLVQWARLLRIPPRHLWFAIPADGPAVRRSEFLAWSGAVMAGAVTAPLIRASAPLTASDLELCTRALAWELWRAGREALHPSELPAALAHRLARLPAAGLNGASLIIRDDEGRYGFPHRALVDVLVAQRIFGEIAEGDHRLFATAQTSHDTDQVIRRYVQQDEKAMKWLGRWLGRGTPVLRVNAAGVLAKVGDPVVGDHVITTLRRDQDAQHLYLTAVVARVATLGWAEAELVATAVMSNDRALPAGRETELVGRFAAELGNAGDDVARWCSTLVLSKAGIDRDGLEPLLQRRLSAEPCRENLRALGATLTGQDPATV